jgi:hypothetical protein
LTPQKTAAYWKEVNNSGYWLEIPLKLTAYSGILPLNFPQLPSLVTISCLQFIITGELKSQFDKVWKAFWASGLSNQFINRY